MSGFFFSLYVLRLRAVLMNESNDGQKNNTTSGKSQSRFKANIVCTRCSQFDQTDKQRTIEKGNHREKSLTTHFGPYASAS